MSLSRDNMRCCDPEMIFELADGALSPSRRREAETHLGSCEGCRSRYEREVRINEGLTAFEGHSLKSSVCREVAISLPCRSVKSRAVFAALAVAILAAAGLALSFDGSSPLVFAAGTLDSLWSLASFAGDMAGMALILAAPFIVVALIVGIILDIAIAGVVYSAMRRRVGSSKRA